MRLARRHERRGRGARDGEDRRRRHESAGGQPRALTRVHGAAVQWPSCSAPGHVACDARLRITGVDGDRVVVRYEGGAKGARIGFIVGGVVPTFWHDATAFDALCAAATHCLTFTALLTAEPVAFADVMH